MRVEQMATPDAEGPERTAVSFQVQREFHEVPLGIEGDTDTLDQQMREFAEAYWGAHEGRKPVRDLFAAAQTANSEQLAADGVLRHFMGVFPVAETTTDGAERAERISRCTLLVSVRDIDNHDPEVSAVGIAKVLSAGDKDGVQLVSLPVGPAVVRIAGSRAVWDIAGGAKERYLIRIELWVPFPEEDRLLLCCLSTSHVEDLVLYQGVLSEIADTISFGDLSETEEADGAEIRAQVGAATEGAEERTPHV